MVSHHILSVGYQFPGGEVDVIEWDFKRSLLDADIVVFEPSIACEVESSHFFEDNTALPEGLSLKS